ncbi:MAG: hypothetical protein HQK76_03605 [Desulfobacterales bacterium]|nr:hypothetical protein [Desulfobacterales bacterium]
MKVLKNYVFLFIICFFVLPYRVYPGTISLELKTTVELNKTVIFITLEIKNNGDSEAYKVLPKVHILNEIHQGQIIQSIIPGQTDISHFEINIKEITKGRYPLVIDVDFHDGNNYPFSALSGMTFHNIEDVNPNLAVTAKDISIELAGMLEVTLKNLDSFDKNIVAKLVLPKEIISPNPKLEFNLNAKSAKKIEFNVKNFAASNLASYPVVCFFEFEHEKFHYTQLAKSIIHIKPEENFFRKTRRTWEILSFILGLALIAAIIYNFLKQRQSIKLK